MCGWLKYKKAWCENVTDEAARLSALTNGHSPRKDRVNGVVQFQKAFACRVGQPMVRRPACRVCRNVGYFEKPFQAPQQNIALRRALFQPASDRAPEDAGYGAKHLRLDRLVLRH
jgi:hypothetical protein